MACISHKIVEYLVKPIYKQFGTLTNFNDNVEDLTKQVEKLETINLKVKQLVEDSRSNAVDIYPDVERWLSNVDKIIQQVGRIQDEIKLKKNNCIYRFWLSRKSKKKAVTGTRLLEEGNQVSRL